MPEQSLPEIWYTLFYAPTPEAEREAAQIIAKRYGLREDEVKTERTGGGLLVGPIPDPRGSVRAFAR